MKDCARLLRPPPEQREALRRLDARPTTAGGTGTSPAPRRLSRSAAERRKPLS
jgi:hypothetical protein